MLTRYGGPAAALGGVSFMAWGYVHRDGAPPLYSAAATVLALVVPALFLVGLAGFYARHGIGAGLLGRVGLALGCTGSVWGMAHASVVGPSFWPLWFSFWRAVAPEERWLPPLFSWFPVLLDGLALVGAATVLTSRAKASRGRGRFLLLVASLGWAYHLTGTYLDVLVGVRLAHVVFGLLFGLGWVALGYALWPARTRKSGRGAGSSRG